MTKTQLKSLGLAAVIVSAAGQIAAQNAGSSLASAPSKPNSWVDPDTNHRVIQLTTEPSSHTLYFTDNIFTPGGREMVYLASGKIYALNMATYESRILVPGPAMDIVVARKSPIVYFMRPNDRGLYAVGVNSGQILKVGDLPARASISTLNADETLAAGTYTEVDMPAHPIDPNIHPDSVRADQMDKRLAAHLPMVLFTLDLRSGSVAKVLQSTDWLNHVQFSPTDPHLLLYCHEGLWWKVDRIWTVRTDGSQNVLIHKRTVNDEIAGHEFWDADGVTVWYDLQIPRGQSFYLASYNTKTGARHWYSVQRDAWSIHYNANSDDSHFCGDGGDYSQVAKSRNGQWIELFTPKESPVPKEVDQTGLTQSGFLQPHHLVNMAKQNYAEEPNVHFSPDGKLVIFSANILGPSYVFAVEVAKATPTETTP
jgi:oligogalacturonide lyase